LETGWRQAVTTKPIHRSIRWSGRLIGGGLVVQMLSLTWTHPLSFMGFILIGCPLVGAGILFFLYSLVAHESA
jgi:hypothetical protein